MPGIIVGGGVDHGVNLISVEQTKNDKFIGPPLKYIFSQTSKNCTHDGICCGRRRRNRISSENSGF